MNVMPTVELVGIPEGSVLNNVVEVVVDGVKCWQGMWCSMYGSYMEIVSQDDAVEHE